MKAKIKKFISFILVLSMVLPTSVGAFNFSENNTVDLISANQDFEFYEMAGYRDGKKIYVLNYLPNGTVEKTFSFNNESPYISVTCSNGEEYVIDITEYVTVETSQIDSSEIMPYASGLRRNLGVVYYNDLKTPVLNAPRANLVFDVVNTYKNTYTVRTNYGDTYSDCIAVLTKILSTVIGFYIPSKAIPQIAAILLDEIVIKTGAEFVKDRINQALNESFNSVTSETTVTAEFTALNYPSVLRPSYKGQINMIFYSDTDVWLDHTGYTNAESSWRTPTFAYTIWDDTYYRVSRVPCPGINRWIVNYD